MAQLKSREEYWTTERITELEKTVKEKEDKIRRLELWLDEDRKEIENLEVDLEAQEARFETERKAYKRLFAKLGVPEVADAFEEEYWRVYYDDYIDGGEHSLGGIFQKYFLQDIPTDHPLLKIANRNKQTQEEEID
jgi:hypothetical protein